MITRWIVMGLVGLGMLVAGCGSNDQTGAPLIGTVAEAIRATCAEQSQGC